MSGRKLALKNLIAKFESQVAVKGYLAFFFLPERTNFCPSLTYTYLIEYEVTYTKVCTMHLAGRQKQNIRRYRKMKEKIKIEESRKYTTDLDTVITRENVLYLQINT